MSAPRSIPFGIALDALNQAADLGFVLAGVARAGPSSHAGHIRSWLAEQRHGEMHYLADPLDVRLDPGQLVAGAKSIVLVADAYPTEGKGPRGQGAEGPRGRGVAGPSEGEGPGEEGEATDPTRPGDARVEHRSPVTAHRSPAHRSPATSRIARYAWGDDYHKVMKKRLFALADALKEAHPDATFRCCVDTAPLLEREHAARAGMGWIGKHTLLLHPRHGSFLLLGAIVTDLDLATSEELDHPGSLVPPTDRCGTCTRCIDACPTGCIFDHRLNDYPGPHTDGAGAGSEERGVGEEHPASPLPGVQRAGGAGAGGEEREAGSEERGASVAAPLRAIDAARCISYLTIEHRSAIAPELHAPMGNWLIGCDVCQDVCPYNNASATQHALDTDTPAPREPLPIHLRYRPREELAVGLDPFEVLQWAEDDRRRVFQGSALKRVKLDMLHRNALIVLTNAAAGLPPDDDRRAAALAETQRLTDDPNASPMVRETARVCQSRLQSRPMSPAQ